MDIKISQLQFNSVLCFVFYVLVDALHPTQQFFSYVRAMSCVPGLNQNSEEDIVSYSRTQHSASVESQTNDP